MKDTELHSAQQNMDLLKKQILDFGTKFENFQEQINKSQKNQEIDQGIRRTKRIQITIDDELKNLKNNVSVLQNEKNEIEGNLGTMQARLLEEQKQKEEFATNYLILKQDFDTLKLELAEERKKWQSRQETDVNSQEQQKTSKYR